VVRMTAIKHIMLSSRNLISATGNVYRRTGIFDFGLIHHLLRVQLLTINYKGATQLLVVVSTVLINKVDFKVFSVGPSEVANLSLVRLGYPAKVNATVTITVLGEIFGGFKALGWWRVPVVTRKVSELEGMGNLFPRHFIHNCADTVVTKGLFASSIFLILSIYVI